ncbi:hypothetical protein THRCLA_21598 [Thraustotheca clavata]|uniref:Major facilitator superfamily (MFS) profile domain-containing protein n=1 Tax=Thraustotheca clavata TaxID=74557 RepID=A0A1V9ZUY2_9STRA|nr:hypothetical protein THRCLA_21598 [Thraustotheca clavata]
MATWLGNLLVGVFYPTLSKDNALGNYAFFIFVGFLIFYILFTYFVVPETAHKTSDEIQREFNIEPAPVAEKEINADPWEK